MYVLDKDRARKILLEEKKIPPYQIDRFLNLFPPIDSSLGNVVDQWLDKKVLPDVVIDGIALKKVMEIRRCHFLVAVRDLSHMVNPELAPDKRERWRKILTTPVYYE